MFPAVILAGGQSRRMGQDKATVTLAGAPLLRHVAHRLSGQTSRLAINAPASPQLDAPFHHLPDTLEGFLGPLAGILAAMRFAAHLPDQPSHVLTTAIDTPFIPLDLAPRLSGALTGDTAISVASSLGAMHPVCGLWPVRLADDLEAFLHSPEKARVKTFLSRHNTAAVEFPTLMTTAGPLDPFFNVNTREDLELAERYMEILP
ncbi:molybdenum cofactor guanylyltransferase MobA [Rhizobium helianthi]|uniref:Molybdenum cofactor guanylyltransferase n=1 Tax=Rhizobium helianthi TaxID=1132695 RepID=A0ABW4LXV3_9HYPH